MIIPVTPRKYPIITVAKFTHLLIMDGLNILFCALNHYSTGIIINVVLTAFHILVFSSDFLFRTCKFKKSKKYSQTLFEIVYFLSAYLCLMGLLMYFTSYIRNPISELSK